MDITRTVTRRMTAAEVLRQRRLSSRNKKVSTEEEQQEHVTWNKRNDSAWLVSFAATMIPFVSFCYAGANNRGLFVRSLEKIAKSRVGVYGFLALPLVTLGMEKCIYDTVQCLQGVDPKDVPENRGGFPSGGGTLLPSFSLVPVQKW